MNKVEVVLSIVAIGIVLLIAGMIYYEQTNQIDIWLNEHPGELLDIGSPPRLENMIVTILVLSVAIGIILKLCPRDDKLKKP